MIRVSGFRNAMYIAALKGLAIVIVTANQVGMDGEKVQAFLSVAGDASIDDARQYLERYPDVNAALAAYFEGGSLQPPSAPSGSSEGSSRPASTSPFAPKKNNNQTKLRSLADIINDTNAEGEEQAEDEEFDEDDKGPQQYFAGGEKSGLALEDPNRKRRPKQLVQDILRKAAQNAPPPDEEAESSNSGKQKAFTGPGNTLGSDEVTSERIPSSSSSNVGPTPSSRVVMPGSFEQGQDFPELLTGDEEVIKRTLTFWRNGFSIEDGPLLAYDDPKNQEILQAFNTGHAPLALLKVKFGQCVDVQVSRRMDEDYQEPPPKPRKYFEGEGGNRLGSTLLSPSSPAPERKPTPIPSSLEVDQSKPKTRIRIQLGSGEKITAVLNTTHTIGDLRRYIDSHAPSASSQQYVLMTTFPSQQLTDETKTLEEISGTMVIQRLL